jgi:hypothetical protein
MVRIRAIWTLADLEIGAPGRAHRLNGLRAEAKTIPQGLKRNLLPSAYVGVEGRTPGAKHIFWRKL